MPFALLVNETREEFADRTDPQRSGDYWAAYTAFGQAMREAGVLMGGHALEPGHTGSTLRLRDGGRQVQDGPFADTREVLGGLYVLDVPTLEDALAWAEKCPSALRGSVEVRPLMVMGQAD